MNISLTSLSAFSEVALRGNISKAAMHLGMTQPALSWSIRKLEEQLGVTLFHRTKKGVVLTRAGTMLLARANGLLRDWHALAKDLIAGEENIGGTYTLGVHQTVAMFTVPKFCPALLNAYPAIDLRLEHGFSRHIAEGVIQFTFDYGIVVNPPRHPDLTIVDLYEDELTFWTTDRAGPLQQYQDRQGILICNPDILESEKLTREFVRSGRLAATRVMHITDLNLMAALVAAGTGIGLLPSTVARGYPGGTLKPIAGAPRHADVISLVWRGEAQRSRTSQLIREAVTTAFPFPRGGHGP